MFIFIVNSTLHSWQYVLNFNYLTQERKELRVEVMQNNRQQLLAPNFSASAGLSALVALILIAIGQVFKQYFSNSRQGNLAAGGSFKTKLFFNLSLEILKRNKGIESSIAFGRISTTSFDVFLLSGTKGWGILRLTAINETVFMWNLRLLTTALTHFYCLMRLSLNTSLDENILRLKSWNHETFVLDTGLISDYAFVKNILQQIENIIQCRFLNPSLFRSWITYFCVFSYFPIKFKNVLWRFKHQVWTFWGIFKPNW